MPVRPCTRLRAAKLGWYPSARAAARTRRTVPSLSRAPGVPASA